MKKQKRAVVINDISCYGRCALTISLPLLSAAGIETLVLPTALLSSHLGFPGPTCLDLTEELYKIAAHWHTLHLSFDAISTGFLASEAQVDFVADFIDANKTGNTLVLVDPTMGDNGRLYDEKMFHSSFISKFARLLSKADITVPNITEACLFLGMDYKEGPYEKEYIETLLKGISGLGPKKVILTGVYFNDNSIGCAVYDKDSGAANYITSSRQKGGYVGTGDLFAGTLLAGLLNGFSLPAAAEIAVDYISYAIDHSNTVNTDNVMGVNFEQCTPYLLQKLNLLPNF